MYPKNVAKAKVSELQIFMSSDVNKGTPTQILTKNTECVVSVFPYTRIQKWKLVDMFPYCKAHNT